MNYKIELELNETETEHLALALAAYQMSDTLKDEFIWPVYEKIREQTAIRRHKNQVQSNVSQIMKQFAELLYSPEYEEPDLWAESDMELIKIGAKMDSAIFVMDYNHNLSGILEEGEDIDPSLLYFEWDSNTKKLTKMKGEMKLVRSPD